MNQTPENQGLYEPIHEHDACGIGAVVNISGRRDHTILEYGKQILLNLHHRGAAGADNVTGDGAGILFQIPHEFFQSECKNREITLPQPATYGVGMVFDSRDSHIQARCDAILEKAIEHYGMKVLGWRDVPVKNDCLGPIALRAEPAIKQIFVDGKGFQGEELERHLFLARRRAEKRFLCCVIVVPDDLLQGHVYGMAVVCVLSGFVGRTHCLRPGDCTSAVQHQHLS
jgi:glutamate synthase (NADPH/NADH) large chain